MMQFKEPKIAMVDGRRLAYEEEIYHERAKQQARLFKFVGFDA